MFSYREFWELSIYAMIMKNKKISAESYKFCDILQNFQMC